MTRSFALLTSLVMLALLGVVSALIWAPASVDAKVILGLVGGSLVGALASLLAGFQQVLARQDVTVTLRFEGVQVPQEIARAYTGVNPEEYFDPLDTRPRTLLGRDNNLALANLRMLLEREVRRIAAEADIFAKQPTSMMSIVDELIRRERIPNSVRRPLREVYNACSQAIHGLEVPDDVATRVVSVGEELLFYLKRSVSGFSHKPASF